MAKTKAKAKAAKKTPAKKAKVAPKKKAAKKPAAKKAAKKPAASKPAASKAPAKKPAVKAAKKAAKKPAAKKVAKAPAATTKPARKSADLKTKPTAASVNDFLDSLDPIRAAECKELVDLMREATGVEPKMWGAAVVGFGDWHYKYDSGREGDFFQVGFSPRKGALTLYIVRGYENHADLLARLGKHSTGKSCLYVKRLADVDRTVLSELITRGVAEVVAGSKA